LNLIAWYRGRVARLSSAKAPTAVRICSVPHFPLCLTPEEDRFFQYWQDQRNRKKEFLRKFSIGLPLVALVGIAFFINFLSGWYSKADKELRRHSSLIIVILVGVVATIVFVTIFAARHRWDQNESDYQALLKKKNGIPPNATKN
jgi:hypothetical protein